MQKDMNIDSLPPAIVTENLRPSGGRHHSDSVVSNSSFDGTLDSIDIDPEIAEAMIQFEQSDSPKVALRKKLT